MIPVAELAFSFALTQSLLSSRLRGTSMSFTVDDLLQDCQKCGGSGQKPSPKASTGGSSFSPHVIATYDDNKCGACRGTGKELTEAGRAIESVVEYVIQKRKSMYGSV
jgi:DnaJ-class molecular chaperone